MPDRSEIMQVFARNLRALVARRPSISHVCRDLEINRSQFNRYLSGAAQPRPDVLHRICRYFDCDARILQTPLHEIGDNGRSTWPFAGAEDPFGVLTRDFEHARMPDGLYQFVLPNMVEPGALVVDLIRLFTSENGTKGVSWSVPRPYAESIGMKRGLHARKLTGFAYQHIDGVSLLLANPVSRHLMMCFVTQGYRGVPTVYAGYAALTLSKGPMQSQVQPLIIERLPRNCADTLRIRRAHRTIRIGDLPQAQRQYLETWTSP